MTIKTNIVVDFDTRKASSNSKKLKKDTDDLSKSTGGLTKTLGGLKTLLPAIGIGILASGLVAATFDALEFADSIGKTADKLGVTTTALQEYRFAAEQTGLTTKQLDIGIQRFTRRLGEAAEGAGVLAPIMKELNIELRDSQGNLRSTEDVLDDYADAIQDAGSSQKQLLLAFKAFDTEGVAFVNTLKDGSEGLQELRDQAVDLGLIMDEDLIRKAEVATDKWNILTTVIGVKFKSALISALSVFTDLRTPQETLESLEHQLKGVNAEILRLADQRIIKQSNNDSLVGLDKKLLNAHNRSVSLRDEIDKLSESLQKPQTGTSGGSDASFKTEEEKNDELMRMGEAFREADAEASRTALEEKLQSETELILFAEAMRTQTLQELEEQAIAQTAMNSAKRMEAVSKTFGTLSVLTASSSKKVFELGKAASIASALINTYQAVTATMAATPYPWNIPLAAAQLAAGLVQVQSIKSQTFTSKAHAGLDRNPEEQTVLVKKDEMILDSGTSKEVRENVLSATNKDNKAGISSLEVKIDAIDSQSFEDRIGGSGIMEVIYNGIITRLNEEGRGLA